MIGLFKTNILFIGLALVLSESINKKFVVIANHYYLQPLSHNKVLKTHSLSLKNSD